jgi:hypothetical protein
MVCAKITIAESSSATIVNFAARLIDPVYITLQLPCEDQRGQNPPLKYWELVADKRSKAGWSWGCVSAIDCKGRTIFVADAHRGDGKRFIVHSDEKLSAFLELERETLTVTFYLEPIRGGDQ